MGMAWLGNGAGKAPSCLVDGLTARQPARRGNLAMTPTHPYNLHPRAHNCTLDFVLRAHF